ncbi:DUF2147 domain-containing protein [Campylobacter sp. MG1]|uniref:DUF2147 domain-containing protein n=1 Tax=Campylobacter sp. MG1 TaxID=2976332 RepID=UPI00226C6989|nr:DUF2147 domain-containing protein [Campylobacter sp. MG1]
MKKIFLCLGLLGSLLAKDYGNYISIDENGKKTARWHIYEENNELFGKVVKLFEYGDDEPCKKCKKTYDNFDYIKDARNMKIVGAPLLYKLKKIDDNNYKDGYVIDPDNGKLYKANAKFDGDKFILRGFIGFSLIGRSQTWIKEK